MKKTLEFKCSPTAKQRALIDNWLVRLKQIWNGCVDREKESLRRYQRSMVSTPIPESLQLKHPKKDKAKSKRYVGAGVKVSKKSGAKYCPVSIARFQDEPDNKKLVSTGWFSAREAPWWADIPSKYKAEVQNDLKNALQKFKKAGKGFPRIKGRNDKLQSLSNRNAGGKKADLNPVAIPGSDNGYVSFPVLGKIYVKGLFGRGFNFDPLDRDEQGRVRWGEARILKEPSGYYLQVVVDSDRGEFAHNDRAVGIDPGVNSVIATDGGVLVKAPRRYKQDAKKLARMQRSLSRKEKGSKNFRKAADKLARQHEKIRRNRSAFNHKISSRLVKQYDGIAWEDTKLTNMNRRPKPKQREDGKGYAQNGAKRKAGLNKSLADCAIGDLRAKTEGKAKLRGREFVKTPAQYSSQTCNACGTIDKKNRKGERFLCRSCGHFLNADVNAARNHLYNGNMQFERIYRAWSREVKPVSAGDVPAGETARALPKAVSETGSCSQQHESVVTDSNHFRSATTKKTKRNRSAQTTAETVVQLGLWDAAVAT